MSGAGEGREKAGVMPPSERQLFLHTLWAPESSVMKPHNPGKELEVCDPRRPPGADAGDEPKCLETAESGGEGLWAASPGTRRRERERWQGTGEEAIRTGCRGASGVQDGEQAQAGGDVARRREAETREHLPAGWGAAPADACSRAQGAGTLMGKDAAREMGFAL